MGTKKTCEQLEDGLNKARVNCEAIHGDKGQQDREKALLNLRDGVTKILVATDVAARGLDIKGVTLVVNFDPPNSSEDYVHRIGRTGRAGKRGTAISFLTVSDQFKGKEIMTVMERNNQTIPKELKQLCDGTLAKQAKEYEDWDRRDRSRDRGYGRDRRHNNNDDNDWKSKDWKSSGDWDRKDRSRSRGRSGWSSSGWSKR